MNFAILLIGADPALARELVTRVHQQLQLAGISVSAGTAESAAGSLDAELADLLRQADQGMYIDKAARRIDRH